MSASTQRQFAVVTGGSSGIGYELAKQFLENGFDVLIAAEQKTEAAASSLGGAGGRVQAVTADLSTEDGVRTLYDAIKQSGRGVDVLAANAGIGLGHAFLDQDRADWVKVVNTNVVGTLDLLQLVGRDMRTAGRGRILITSSIASQLPGTFNAVYNASKAFLQLFSVAFRHELKDSGVTVTALLPGATDTNFFNEAGMQDTKVGASTKKDDAADVAKTGFDAVMAGKEDATHGLMNKLQAVVGKLMPDTAAEMHRGMAEPGSDKKAS